MFCFYTLSTKYPQERTYLPLVENSALAWHPAKLCSSCTHVFHDRYISDYAALFILNLSPLQEGVELIASQFLNICD